MIRHSFFSLSLVGALFAGSMTSTAYGDHSLMEAFFSAYNNAGSSADHNTPTPSDEHSEAPASSDEYLETPAPSDEHSEAPAPSEEHSEAPAPSEEHPETPAPSEEKKTSPTVSATDLQVDVKKVSVAFGHLIGRNLNSPGFRFDLESVITGMREANEGRPSPMTQEEYEQAMATIQAAVFYEMADANLEAAKAFLLANASRPGVIELDPGHLQIRTLHPGTKGGRTVAAHSSPTLHYIGRYADGTVFGTSRNTDEPITLSLDQTIPGFSRGVIGMQEGERREIYVHPALGYATSGHLAPNALLIFDVEIVKAPAPTAIDENLD